MISVMVAGPFSGLLRRGTDGGYVFSNDMRRRIERVHALLDSAGIDVLSAHAAEHYGQTPWTELFVERDLKWVEQCAAQVLLLPRGSDGATTRTDGSMIELGFALARGKPVILLAEDLDHPANSFFLRSLPGRPGLRLIEWSEGFEPRLLEALKECLAPGPLPGSERRQRSDVDGMLADLRKENQPHEVVVGDLTLSVFPEVLSPRYSHSPDFLMSKWQIPCGASVLDIGCGSGILGLAALRNGAKSLLALDVNNSAVSNTRFNARRLGYSNQVEVRCSDAYSAVKPGERFDVILFAAPYWDRCAVDPLERSCYDEGYKFFQAAVAGAPTHLNENGVMYVLFSDQGDVNRAVGFMADAKLLMREMHLSSSSPPAGHIRILWKLTALTH